MSGDVRAVLGFHAVFALAAVLVLGFVPDAWYGHAIAGLVVGYHLMLLVWASARGYSEWLRLWAFLLPLSLLQVVPDWILADFIGSLRFHDHGIPRIGAVPVYMAGMWVIPLFVIVRLADSLRGPFMRGLAAIVLALVVFGSAEWYAQPLGIWQEVGVRHATLGVAWYVLPAEALLGLAAWWGYHVTRERGLATRVLVAAAISVLYTGALVTGYFFIEGGARV